MKKYQWAVALAIVGAVLSTKAAIISAAAVSAGCLIGAVLGFAVGWFLEKGTKSRSPHA
jgi:NhaP-type Na+/H+ or K+/H+ antiporter